MKKILGWVLALSIGVAIGCGTVYFIMKDDSEKKCEAQENNTKCDSNDAKVDSEISATEYIELKSIIDELQYVDILNKDVSDVSKLTKDDLFWFVYYSSSNKEEILLKDVNKVTQKYFGVDIEPGDILCNSNHDGDGEYLYIYNEKNQSFSLNPDHPGHGGGGIISVVYNRYVSSKKNDNTYEVVVNKIFSNTLGDTSIGPNGFYPSYSDALSYKDKLFDVKYNDNDEMVTDIEKEFKGIDSSKLNEYKYTFVKKNNSYVLSKYEILK